MITSGTSAALIASTVAMNANLHHGGGTISVRSLGLFVLSTLIWGSLIVLCMIKADDSDYPARWLTLAGMVFCFPFILMIIFGS